MTALERQIEAANKRIAKYEKNMNMYAVRVDKHIEKLRKNGIILSRDDFQVIKDPKWKYSFEIKVDDHIRKMLPFDKWCAITDALTYQHENTARLVDERKHLDELTEKQRETQQKLEDMQAVDSVLADKLTEALQPFRIQWTESMMQWHAAFYLRIHERLPEAREQYPKLKKQLDDLKYEHGYFSKHPDIIKTETQLKNVSRILSAKPVFYDTQDEYLAYIRPRLDEEFNACIVTLAAKCRPFALQVDQVQVHHTRMGERGFDLLLTDGKQRVVDARAIWAAEDSMYVTPHSRYLVTERQSRTLEQMQPATEQDTGENLLTPSVKTSLDGMEASERITDIAVIRQNMGYGIRCKVDGIQQSARNLNMLECKKYDELLKVGDSEALKSYKKSLAESYFPEKQEIEQGRGVRR